MLHAIPTIKIEQGLVRGKISVVVRGQESALIKQAKASRVLDQSCKLWNQKN